MNSPSTQIPSLYWYDSILLRVIPPIVALICKTLMLSCRVVRVEGQQRELDALSRWGGAIYPTWHQRMLYLSHYLGSRNVTAMISHSRDGEYAARTARLLGFESVRGSTTRGGTEALRAIISRIKRGENGGMLADGPLGPARVAKIGSIIMARSARVPLLPLTWGGDRCWLFNSWDQYLVPKPFARVVVYIAEPIWVPRSAKVDELEEYRRLLEERLNDGTRWCDEQFGAERPWQKVKAEGPGVPKPTEDG
jgi:lysophospholipid acyltransferase (LPLAT)-like uncharacterized protein